MQGKTTSYTPTTRRPWPEKRRQAQAQRCRAQKPWRYATGPKTRAGKARVIRNAYKHGRRSVPYLRQLALLRALLRLLRQQGRTYRQKEQKSSPPDKFYASYCGAFPLGIAPPNG